MIKSLFYLSFIVFFNIDVYSQVTIGQIPKKNDSFVLKTKPYNNLLDFEETYDEYGDISLFKKIDYNQYIGLKFYLPPLSYPKEKKSNGDFYPIVFSSKISILKEDSLNKFATAIYKPFYYRNYGYANEYISNSTEIGDRYYTLINVFQNTDYIKNYEGLKSKIEKFAEKNNLKECRLENNKGDEDIMFQLKDDLKGDTVYCFDLYKFVLVPFFVKQKELCENKNFICTGYSGMNIKDLITDKYVNVEKGSNWLCKEVTLLKNEGVNELQNYSIYYILSDDYGSTIALDKRSWRSENHYFTDENTILKRQNEEKIKNQKIIAAEQKLIAEEQRKEQIEIERKRKEMINKYGQSDGELILQKKLRIGFNQNMCIDSWGSPFSKSKTTTENNVYENWHYLWGRCLNFENGILKRIDE